MEAAVTVTDRRSVHEAYGVAFALRVRHDHAGSCPTPDLVDRAADRLPPGAVERPDATPVVGEVTLTCRNDGYTLTGADGEDERHGDPTAALHQLDGAIRAVVAVHAPGLVFIHAGSVAVDGRVLVLPGRSMAGKTTLVAALVEAGATYLSDEYAVFDTDGLVRPYPRRLSIRDADGRREVAAADLGAATATGPLPVALVARIVYDAAAGWQVGADGQVACVDALISNAVAAQPRSAEVLSLAASVARTTPFFAGTRGDVTDAVAAVFDLVASLDAVEQTVEAS